MRAARPQKGMQLKKDAIATMIDLYLDDNFAGARQALKKLLKDTVFLDSLNIKEFEQLLSRTARFFPGMCCFDARKILLAEWDQKERNYKSHTQEEVPVPPGQEEAVEMKIHVESLNPVALPMQSVVQTPVAWLSLGEILRTLEKALKTPEAWKITYDTLEQIKQKQQLESLAHHGDAEIKYAAEQPALVYSASSSSSAYTPPAASFLPPLEDDSHIPCSVEQPRAEVPEPSAPPQWAIKQGDKS